MIAWILFIVQAAVSSAGVLLLRHAMPQILDKTEATPTLAWVWAGVGAFAYGSSFLLWLYILSKTPVSFAYPVTIGLTLAMTVLGSMLILGERVSAVQIIGILFMAVAVFLMSAGQNSSPPLTTTVISDDGRT